MPTLTIGDRKVKVGEEFLKLSPDQQQQAVEQIASEIGIAPKEPAPAGEGQSVASGLVDAFTHGATAGLGPKITSHEAAILGRTPEGGWFDYSKPYGERQQRALEAERGQQAEFREERPIAGTAAEIAGLVAGPGKALSAVGATRLVPAGMKGAKGLAARSAAVGADAAAIGGVEAFGADQDIGEGALAAGLTGAAMNPAVERFSKAISRSLANRRIRKAAPTREGLRESAQQAYETMEANQVAFSPQAYQRLAGTVQQKMRGEVDEVLHPGAMRVMQRITGEAGGGAMPTIKHLDMVRRQASGRVGVALRAGNKDEARLLRDTIDSIDEFMTTAGPGDIVTSGDKDLALRSLKQARELWFRRAKAEDVETALKLALEGGYTTGTEQAIRLQFAGMIRRGARHPEYRHKFTDDEWEAVKTVATGGGPMGAQNLLRMLGQFGWSFGNARNQLGPLIGAAGVAGGASLTGMNPLLALPVMAAGTAARPAADAMARRGAETALGRMTLGPQGAAQAAAPRNMIERLLADPEAMERITKALAAAGARPDLQTSP